MGMMGINYCNMGIKSGYTNKEKINIRHFPAIWHSPDYYAFDAGLAQESDGNLSIVRMTKQI